MSFGPRVICRRVERNTRYIFNQPLVFSGWVVGRYRLVGTVSQGYRLGVVASV